MQANHEIAQVWRHKVEPGYRWRRCASQAGVLGDIAEGEAGGFFVQCDALPGRRAYLKPRKKPVRPSWLRAAREKIAADLAHDIGVAVPPVVLHRRDDPEGDERHVCVSLVMHPRQWSWAQLLKFLSDADASDTGRLLLRLMPVAAADAWVFDTWVDQTDHGSDTDEGHPHNIILGYNPADTTSAELLFLDYAFSMGCGGNWDAHGYRDVRPARFPRKLREHADRLRMRETVERVQELEEATVRNVVERVPEFYLPQDMKPQIIDGLLERRKQLGVAFAPVFQEARP